MKTSKEIALIGVFVALLIGGQFVLSALQGIEIVTLLITTFCFYFGVKRGVIVATTFSLIRCFLFGFYANVITLYLLYYNLIAIIFGSLGKVFNKTVTLKSLVVLTLTAVLSTAVFFLFDGVITALFYSFTIGALKVYLTASIPALITQLICVTASCGALFIPIVSLYKTIKI